MLASSSSMRTVEDQACLRKQSTAKSAREDVDHSPGRGQLLTRSDIGSTDGAFYHEKSCFSVAPISSSAHST
jgi:hypothetical protein